MVGELSLSQLEFPSSHVLLKQLGGNLRGASMLHMDVIGHVLDNVNEHK